MADEEYSQPSDKLVEGESRGVYTIANIPIHQLEMLENAKTLFRLNLTPNADLVETGYSLLNVVTLQEETIKKQFPDKNAKGEVEADKIKIDGMTITDYREQIESALLKHSAKVLNAIVFHRIAHNCNLIFDAYMVNLNDALPMHRTNPEDKLGSRLFALVPNADPKRMAAEHDIINEKRMASLKEKKARR